MIMIIIDDLQSWHFSAFLLRSSQLSLDGHNGYVMVTIPCDHGIPWPQDASRAGAQNHHSAIHLDEMEGGDPTKPQGTTAVDPAVLGRDGQIFFVWFLVKFLWFIVVY